MRTRAARAVAAAFAIVTTTAASACSRGDRLEWPARPPGEQRGGVLRLATSEDVPTLDPALGYDTTSWAYEQHLFETLFTYDDAGELVPSLAEHWERSADGLRYTFTLPEGVVFSDGTPLTASDAAGSLERVLNPKTSSQGAEYYREIRGARDYVAGTSEHVAGLTTPDPRTLVIELEAPDALFLHKLALLFASVVPVALARRLGDDFSMAPIGSGPFVLREWRRGERIVLARNPRYRRADRPYLDGVVEQIGVNEQLTWLMFESGELDLSGIPPADFPAVMRDPSRADQLVHAATLTTEFIGINCQIPPLDDRRVRQALNYAVNKSEVIALLNGRGIVARGVVPANMPGYHAELDGYPYDPAKARALLESAGQGGGFSVELWTRGAGDLELKMAQKLQQDLARVGVTLSIKSVAWSSFLEAIRQPRTVPLFILGWSADFPDPENFLDILFHTGQDNNHSFYSNPEVDRRLEAARPITEPAARTRAYAEIERMIVDDAPVILLYQPITYVIHTPRVHGYRIHPLLPGRFTDVWLDPEPVAGGGSGR